MLELKKKLTVDKELMDSPNLADEFEKEDLDKIGDWCWRGYQQDLGTRETWMKRTQAALDLAQQVVKVKTFPWPNAANVAFPLVTIAAMQFHARAYPALVDGKDLVKYRVVGFDPTREERAQGATMCKIMNQQLLEGDCAWEEQEDRLLLVASITGTAFKKSYWDAEEGQLRSELVLPQDLVLDYHAKSVEACPRKTQHLPKYRNEIYEAVKTGLYRDILDEEWYKSLPQVREEGPEDKRAGTEPPAQADETTPFMFLEQHCLLDLDGDGYAEPYIVTFAKDSKCVVRIVARFDREEDVTRGNGREIIRIQATEYFTKRGFIPSPDGGIMDVGFGMLLGPINESVSTILNQLIDAGTMQTTAGGFLGRGAKIRGGTFTFSPMQWLRVDSTGDDLAKSIVPLPVREPSTVLFQLLGLLIEYANRIASATETLVGENPGQNTPAETSRTMVQQGLKIYGAIFKRQWRGLKAEFKKLYKLNAVYLDETRRQFFLGDPNRVVPAADPNIVSEQQRLQQALMVKQSAMATPGYDPEAVEMFFLRSLQVEDMEVLYGGLQKFPPSPDGKVAVDMKKLEIEQGKLQLSMMEFKQSQLEFILELQEEQRLNNAQIINLMAQAAEHQANAAAEPLYAEAQRAIGVLEVRNQSIEAMKTRIMAAKVLVDNRKVDVDEKKVAKQNAGKSD